MAKKWFVIHTLSGQEGRVKEHIEHQIKSDHLEEIMGRILLPTQEVMAIKKGKKVTSIKKFFPSYLIVEMDLTRETMHLVQSTPGVTNFVGGRTPLPLRADEVERVLGQADPQKRKKSSDIPFIIGDSVKIKDGPFKDFDGTVDEISVEKGKVKVMVSVFGRLTPVELDFLQVNPL
jgi:transcription termination/antitermination protein NusG